MKCISLDDMEVSQGCAPGRSGSHLCPVVGPLPPSRPAMGRGYDVISLVLTLPLPLSHVKSLLPHHNVGPTEVI